MRTVFTLAITVTLAGAVHPALAAEQRSISFQHNDWELACDNTRTCRAAGYHAEGEDNAPVTVLLERRAGPGTAILGRLWLGDVPDAADHPDSVTMVVDGRTLGRVRLGQDAPSGDLSPAQTAALLRAVAGSGKVAWRAGQRSWTLSGKGASAVLLKMDEFQGRLGTPGAAIRKGVKLDNGVLPPVQAPHVTAAKASAATLPALGRDDERRLLATLRRAAGNDECADLDAVATGEGEFAYAPLTQDKMLVSARCWRGAYNEGYGYWVVNRKPPFSPVLVTGSGSDYDQGTISAAHKGRGIGDCWGHDAWVWDGRRFVHTASGTTGMCRGIAAGGAWTLPTLVSEVR